MTRIAIVEDEAAVREQLAGYVQQIGRASCRERV